MRGLISFMAGIVTAGSVAVGVAYSVPVQADDKPEPIVQCYEDQVVAYSGDTGAHTVCVDIDDKDLTGRIARVAQKGN